ncbi:ECF RNA polymerase sigma factor SigW [Stieleria neptunia]|uniref:ECF RNA polymerase sigma factor SigW n=1 Tax=Stieleria neptunia TaxID=2527979 RepID=A0A518I1S8_9BACT|nr:sigma-70 family RNA polymerase sigma factor [Stieleria neptunia]QDV47070.1 ECF RNA polymerase sigma factor SigW [Stieleria neptunia]
MSQLYHDESTSSTLLHRTRQGNRLAQEQIYEIYCPLVYQWSRGVGLGHDDALDNVQQVFIKLFSNIASYDQQQGRFRHWLWRMTKNFAIDQFRKRQRDDAFHREVAMDVRSMDEPASATSNRIPQAVARRAIEVLMDRYEGRTREIAIEVLVHGRPAAAVAQQFNVSLGAVYTNRSRALKLLRESLNELEFFPVPERSPSDTSS